MPPVRRKDLAIGKAGYGHIQFKPFGHWEKTIKVIGRLGPTIKEASLKAQMAVGKEIVKRVKAHLRNQDLGWQALSEKTKKNKAKYGLKSKTLMAWGTYYNNIEVWQPSNHHLVLIGVRKGIYTRHPNGKRNKVEVARIAAMHEFSSGRKIPRRPLWNPTIQELGKKGIKQIYNKALTHHLRMRGVPVSQYKKYL